jgi:hypothetical protein
MRALTVCIGTGLLVAILCVSGAAQTAPAINGPSLAFVADKEGATIWPLLGILGASVPGPPLVLPQDIRDAVISPRHDYALAIAGTNAKVVLVDLTVANPTINPVPGVRPQSTLLSLSPTGAAAALFEKQTRQLQLVLGLPAAPQVVREFDASTLPGEVLGIAVSDDAKLALVNAIQADDETRTLWLVGREDSASPLSVSRPSHVAFIANTSSALIVEQDIQEVVLMQHLNDNPVRMPGIVMRESGHPIAAIAASHDGRSIFVAQEGSEDISVTDLQSRTTVVVPCHCKPTVFSPLKGTSVFRLNDLSTGPITVLDARPGLPPRTLIIPVNPSKFSKEAQGER